MKKQLFTAALTLLLCAFPSLLLAGTARIGGGLSYWTSIEDLDDWDDKDGYSLYVSYQYWEGLIGFEADLEFLPDRFGENAVSPHAWLLIGDFIYGGIGIATTYTDGDWADEPSYALRAGLAFHVMPRIIADINTTYRFNDLADFDDEKSDIDTDTLFLGAAVRFEF